jgi:hypothetical protein
VRSLLRRLRRVGPLGLALTAGQVALVVHEHWHRLPVDRRRRLQELLRDSKGHPKRLSREERAELRSLVTELNLTRLARRTARVAATGTRRTRS